MLNVLMLAGSPVDSSGVGRGAPGAGSRTDRRTASQLSLTGGPHLDSVVLVRLADDVLSPDAEAVVAGVPEGVGQVVGHAGHRHWLALPFLQWQALGLEAPAHGQGWAVGHGHRLQKQSREGHGPRLRRPAWGGRPGHPAWVGSRPSQEGMPCCAQHPMFQTSKPHRGAGVLPPPQTPRRILGWRGHLRHRWGNQGHILEE